MKKKQTMTGISTIRDIETELLGMGWSVSDIARQPPGELARILKEAKSASDDRSPPPSTVPPPAQSKLPSLPPPLALARSRADVQSVTCQDTRQALQEYQSLVQNMMLKSVLAQRADESDAGAIEASLQADRAQRSDLGQRLQMAEAQMTRRLATKRDMLRLCQDISPDEVQRVNAEMDELRTTLSSLHSLVRDD